MNFDDLLAEIEGRRKTVTVYAPNEEEDVLEQFATRNVTIERVPISSGGPGGFAVIRDDDEFAGAIALEELEEILEPPIRRPWDERVVDAGYRALFEILDETLFSSFDRRQLLAAAREIENRAWRVGSGAIRVGFQRRAALQDQLPVYERFGADTDLDVHVYVGHEADPPDVPGVTVHAEAADEIGSHWFLAFDGGEDEANACALLAEEQSPGLYSGFWTYDPALVEEMLAHLRRAYG